LALLKSMPQPSTYHLGGVIALGGVTMASTPALLPMAEDAAPVVALLPAEDVALALLPTPVAALLPLPCALQIAKAKPHMYFVEHKASTEQG
jgi:hypothetical protein